MRAFRALHPGTDNLVIAHNVTAPYNRAFEGIAVRFLALRDLEAHLPGREKAQG